MVALLVACALGWAAELLVQATVPLLILDRGGTAAVVGLVSFAYAVPSLVLRPLVGRRIDRDGHGAMHQLGAGLLIVGPLLLTLGAVPALLLGRFTQGLGWAMFGTANNVVLARHAPVARRGEASAWFNVMWAIGFLVGPPVGLALYAGVSQELPFLVASGFAAAALIAAAVLRRLLPPAAATPATAATPEARRLLGRFLEPAAVPTMAILSTFMAGQALFLAFAPVYARSIGAPDAVLAVYFPLYGSVLVLGQLVTGRVSDRFGRRAAILAACSLGSAGLLVVGLASSWIVFAAGAGAFALGAAILNPAAAAATIDRAPVGRTGVAMATFSIGYQVAFGLGGALWGAIIASVGYPAPFFVAVGLQVACAAIAIRYLSPASGPAAPALSRP
jgi:MFS family permease